MAEAFSMATMPREAVRSSSTRSTRIWLSPTRHTRIYIPLWRVSGREIFISFVSFLRKIFGLPRWLGKRLMNTVQVPVSKRLDAAAAALCNLPHLRLEGRVRDVLGLAVRV